MNILESFVYSNTLFQVNFICYVITFFIYIISYIIYIINLDKVVRIKSYKLNIKNMFSKLSIGLFRFSALVTFFLIINQWIAAGRPPFKTLYETLIYLIFTISILYVIIEPFFEFKVMGLFLSLLILRLFFYALSERDIEIVSIPPSLQTPIMIPHVTSYFFAYGSIFIAFFSALISLVSPYGVKGSYLMSDMKTINLKDNTYKIVCISFIFLTSGLMLGSYWGQVAWSNYWGFDPKENWALISWLMLSIYFHLRKLNRYTEKHLAWFVILISVSILFTYLGMNYLPNSVQQGSDHIYLDSGPNATKF